MADRYEYNIDMNAYFLKSRFLPNSSSFSKAYDRNGYRRGGARPSKKVRGGHSSMDVPPRSSTAPRIAKKSLQFFQKTPHVNEDAKRHPDGRRMTQKEFELYKLAAMREFDDKNLSELLDHYRGGDEGWGEVNDTEVHPRYIKIAQDEQDRRKDKVQQTIQEEEDKKKYESYKEEEKIGRKNGRRNGSKAFII